MLKKLFLSHYHGEAAEVHELATDLRLRGVVPWVDKDGGFAIADESVSEARRAIREDCFGFLLYATRKAFFSRFIRDVEVEEALRVRERDPGFLLFAVPRQLSFAQLAKLSSRNFEKDLSAFHTVPVPEGADAASALSKVASEVLSKVLHRAILDGSRCQISIQFSTRETMPDEADDVLKIDTTRLFVDAVGKPAAWERLLHALRDVKRQVAATYGRPYVSVHGSKHLTAAFMFGHVFAPFELAIRQTPDQIWRTNAATPSVLPFVSEVQNTGTKSGKMFVEVASGYKNIAAGADVFLPRDEPYPLRLQMRPAGGPLDVDNQLCRAMVRQTYSEIERAVQQHSVQEIHLFVAAPQSFMMMLGREFKGMPPVHLYEWVNDVYVHSCCVR